MPHPRHLILACGVWFPVAVIAAAGRFVSLVSREAQFHTRALVQAPLFSWASWVPWLLLFSALAHKEERFMYPAYMSITVCAGLVLCDVKGKTWKTLIALMFLGQVGTSGQNALLYFTYAVFLYQALFFVSRVSALVVRAVHPHFIRSYMLLKVGYRAPLAVTGMLADHVAVGTVRNCSVCMGKEWHRFPSSFFLPGILSCPYIWLFTLIFPRHLHLEVFTVEFHRATTSCVGWIRRYLCHL